MTVKPRPQLTWGIAARKLLAKRGLGETMLIRKIHLSRRTVLKGLGVSVGLPLLDAMIPAATALARTAAAPQPCMTFVYFPHGAVMDQWTPKKDGADFDLPPILAPLAPFQKQLTIISGLENRSAAAAPVHATTPGTWLSCVSPRMSHDPCCGITLDQVAAQKIGLYTQLPSLGVGTEEQGGEGSRDRNYGGGYSRTISFRTPSTPLPMEHDPRTLFQQLFGQAKAQPSVLDPVRHNADDLSRTLGPRDRALLDDYLSAIREIEGRVQKPLAFDEHMQLMFDLIALAYQANLTRISTFMMAAEVSNQPYTFIGIPDAFHSLSHHQNNPAKMARLAKVQSFHTRLFASFVRKLARMPDGDGSMLDHSFILYGSNMSNGYLHDHFPLPTALVGGGCGQLQGNQHLRYPDRTPLANLHVALLNKAGIAMKNFGDSTGELAEI